MKGNEADLTRIACLEKKRKLQDEELDIPLPKHVCRGSKEPNKIGSDEFAKGDESDPESTSSNSFHSNSDSPMFIDCEIKTDPDSSEMRTSEDPSTSSASWFGTSSGTSLYSSEIKTSTDMCTSETESLSTKKHDCTEDQYGRHVDIGLLEYGHAEIESYTDKELEDLLCSNGVASGSSYILSSGRWSVNQDAGTRQEGKKKMTIDKEFEQYFSMLML